MRMTGKDDSLSRFHFVLKERHLFGVEKRCPVQALADRLPSGFVGAVRNVGSTNRNLLNYIADGKIYEQKVIYWF